MDRLKGLADEVVLEGEEAEKKGYSALLSVSPDKVVSLAEAAKDDGFFLEFITAEDWKDHITVIYAYRERLSAKRVLVKVDLEGEEPSLPSISVVFSSADPFEREVYDLFGVSFSGHPRLDRLLTPEEMEGYPLRKDWDPEENYKKMEEKLLRSLGLEGSGGA